MEMGQLDVRRWRIAWAAVVMQLCLGSVYAWSIFKKPLMAGHGWTETQVQGAFMIYSFVFPLCVAFGGMLADRMGPRIVGMLGGLLFGTGLFLAGFADRADSLPMLYGAYGLIAGIGGGFGYVTPITALIRWFPDRRGLVTGLAVMGYGLGSFIMGNVGPRLVLAFGIAETFILWGGLSLVLVLSSVSLFSYPPDGWMPSSGSPSGEKESAGSFTFAQAVRTPQFWNLWAMVFLIATAGLGLISQLSPMAQDVMLSQAAGSVSDERMRHIVIASGSIVAIAAIFNGIGRLLWAWTSDAVGRRRVFALLFISGSAGFLLLGLAEGIVPFTLIICYLLACYGGGLACMPAFAADEFGHVNIGKIYGMVFTACGPAGIAGPYLFAAVRQATGSFAAALTFESLLLALGFLLICAFRKPGATVSTG